MTVIETLRQKHDKLSAQRDELSDLILGLDAQISMEGVDPAQEQHLREELRTRELLANEGRADSDEYRVVSRSFRANLKRSGLEFNTPTLILLGSERYRRFSAFYGLEDET